MKKLLLSAVAFLSLSASAYAYVPRVDIRLNQNTATFTIWNTLPRPIICSGQVYGMSASGHTFQTWVTNVHVPPFAYVYAYVNSTVGYNPMVHAWANVGCY